MARRILIRHPSSMATNDPFVEGLRRIFQARPDLTPAAVSTRAGLDNSTIRKLISGANKSPKIETAQRIANAMDYQLSDIIAVGEHSDPTTALDWLRILDQVSPHVREEAIKYALYLQSQNTEAALSRARAVPSDDEEKKQQGADRPEARRSAPLRRSGS
ncbi:helix-turn-helix transcriptional regulator [Paracoccus sp. R12_1]|nr:helix-turn-helix transcriptional regulator [Paracoccus sp. R12_2]MBO9488710.1 helix-turn-helix transcriptional regulator [Paracoccus sp. R12_1]